MTASLILPRLWLPPKEKGLSFHLPRWRDILAMAPGHLAPNNPAGPPTITLVTGQTVSNSTTSSALTLTLPGNPTAGNFIAVQVTSQGNFQSTAVTSVNDTYVLAQREKHTTLSCVETWYAPNIIGGANSKLITVANTASNIAGGAQEFNGVLASSPLDQAGGNTTSLTPGSLTPSVANELWITSAINGSAITNPTGSWVSLFTITPGAYTGCAAYLIAVGSGAQNPTFGGTFANGGSLLVSFKP